MIGFIGGEAVATQRTFTMRGRDCIEFDSYEWPSLALHYGLEVDAVIDRAARIDRGVIHKSFRGHGLFGELQRANEQVAWTCRCDILVAAIVEANAGALTACEKVGWQQYAQHHFPDGRGFVLMTKRIDLSNDVGCFASQVAR